MMHGGTAEPEVVGAVASQLLSEDLLGPPQRLARGYRNENWTVRVRGRSVLVKIAPLDADLGKLAAAWCAQDLAHRSGVPTGKPVGFLERCDALGGRTVRLIEYIEGGRPEDSLGADGSVAPFFASLGETIAHLHRIPVRGFSSRLDGSAPTFDTWEGYVNHRLVSVTQRALDTAVFTKRELRAATEGLDQLAGRVSPVVTPSLTHRDLYLENLLAGEGGTVHALLDWDTAEAWDPMVDLVKLRWQVFSRYVGASQAFWRAYIGAGAPPPLLGERLHLVDVLELVNTVSNARMAGWANFEEQSRRNLEEAVTRFQS